MSSLSDWVTTQPPPDVSMLTECSQALNNALKFGSVVARLISMKNEYPHFELKLYAPELGIEHHEWDLGRTGKGAMFQLHHGQVSATHFKIFYDKERQKFMLNDLSSNGTYINQTLIGQLPNRTFALNNGTIISLVASVGHPSCLVSYYFEECSPDAQLPAIVTNKYIVEDPLGTGSFSTVYRGTNQQTGESVAIKVIDKRKFWQNKTVQTQFEREAQILMRLSHPNIISLIDVLSDEQYLCIVMELATGGELFDKIREVGFYSETEARVIMRQLLKAVQYLHSQNVVHRDLKPENILLAQTFDKDIHVKLTDFGLARLIGPTELMTTLCGTPLYVAPEVVKRATLQTQKGYGSMVDMWSLGAILYVLLSGFPPFDDEQDMADQIIHGKYSFPKELFSDVSSEAIDLIKCLLCTDPNRRLSASQALQHPWFGLKPQSTPHLSSAQKLISKFKSPAHRASPSPLKLSGYGSNTDTDDESDTSSYIAPLEGTTPSSGFPKRSASDYNNKKFTKARKSQTWDVNKEN